MKALLAICMLLASSFALAIETAAPAPAPAPSTITGEVLETKNVEEYTYLRLKTGDGETWAAVTRAEVKKGATVTIMHATMMSNFHSRALNKTFDKLYMGALAGAKKPTQDEKVAMSQAHSGIAKPADTKFIHITKAKAKDARTVEEIVTKNAAYKDKQVTVRGKVVKYNAGIMGKNWVHLSDGTGSAEKNTNDLLVTTTSEAKVGEVITIKGVVRTNKDFGAGYSYKVLVEDATVLR